MSPIPGLNLDKLLGSLLIGTWASSMLSALEIVLAYKYFSSGATDGFAIRGPIFLALVNDTVTMISEFALVYLYTITHWGDPTYLAVEPWPIPIYLITAGLSTTITQAYLITRVNRLFKASILRIPLVMLLGAMCMFCFGGTLAAGIRTSMYPSILERNKTLIPVTISLAAAAATDVAIALTLVVKLLTLQKSHLMMGAGHESRLTGFIRRIILRTIETGSIPAGIAAICLGLYLYDNQSNVAVGIAFTLGRVYTCTFLVSLISRSSDSAFASSGADNSGGLGNLSFGRTGSNVGRSAKGSGVLVNRLATVTVEEPLELGDLRRGGANERAFPGAMRSGNQVFVIGNDVDDKVHYEDASV